jgi:hypothetical protein
VLLPALGAFGQGKRRIREVIPEIVLVEPLAETAGEETGEAPEEVRPFQHEEPGRPAPEGPPSLSREHWSCEIALWSDGQRALFYARSFREDEEVTIAESPSFPGDETSGAKSPASAAAHARLREELLRMGWVPDGRGTEWYGERFRRDFSVAALNASLTAQGPSPRRY